MKKLKNLIERLKEHVEDDNAFYWFITGWIIFVLVPAVILAWAAANPSSLLHLIGFFMMLVILMAFIVGPPVVICWVLRKLFEFTDKNE